MRSVILTILLAIISCGCFSQDTDIPFIPIEHDAISLEIGKTGLVFNLMYDHLFKTNEFGVRAMVGSNPAGLVTLRVAGIGGYYIRGKYRKFIEIGTDLQYFDVKRDIYNQDVFANSTVYPDYTTRTFYASLNGGYRLYFGRLLFRFGLTAGVTKNDFIPGAYTSLGYTF